MEVEEAQSEATEGSKVMVRVTFDEYTEILREILKDYGDKPNHLWHPEDLCNTIEVVNQAIVTLAAIIDERERRLSRSKISDLSEPQAGEFFK